MSIDWSAWKYLLGEWQGGNTGQPGEGRGTFSFTFDLDQNILVRRSHTEYPASAERQAFVHDDLMIVYAEYTGEKRAIYFDNEQHVIHYSASESPDGNTLTLLSDALPSMPQFRFTYIQAGPDTVHGRFEMTPPGKPGAFFTYLEGPSQRVGSK
jgi:hypothetical protein